MNLTAEQINEFISKAVLESQIGDVVKESVQRAIADLGKSYNNPFDVIIKRHVENMIDREVILQYQPKIETGIKEALAKHMSEDIIANIINAAMEKFKRY